MEFSRQVYWSGVPFPSPGDLPDPGIKPASPLSPALQADSLLTELSEKHSIDCSESGSEVAQSCLTLCDPVDHSPPGSSVHGILQARILEWVATSYTHLLIKEKQTNKICAHWNSVLSEGQWRSTCVPVCQACPTVCRDAVRTAGCFFMGRWVLPYRHRSRCSRDHRRFRRVLQEWQIPRRVSHCGGLLDGNTASHGSGLVAFSPGKLTGQSHCLAIQTA